MADFRSKFDTLRWRNDQLELIDQRVLPGEIRYISYVSAAAVAEGIHDMVVRGAPAIGCAAAYGIAVEALRLQRHMPEQFKIGMNAAFEVLGRSRPTAVNLSWALARMRLVWETGDSTPARSASGVVVPDLLRPTGMVRSSAGGFRRGSGVPAGRLMPRLS